MKKVIIIIAIVVGLGFLVGGHFFNKWYHRHVKSHPQMYCYEFFRGKTKPVSVLIIENLDLSEPYLKYYQELETGKEPYLANEIPLKGLPQYDPVYVMGYSSDSLLADVVSYYDRGAYFGGSYLRGWVYAKCLHPAPPPRKEK